MTTQDQRKALQDLFSSAFNSTEGLRQWLSTLDNGQTANNLPGGTVAPAHFNFSAADIVVRYGWVTTSEFWDSLENAVAPPTKPKVHAVRTQFGVASSPSTTPQVSTPASAPEPKPAASREQLIVLLVSASPPDVNRLRVDSEFRDVENKVAATPAASVIRFVHITAARFEDLRTGLLRHKPHVLHISSHGHADGSLTLENRDTTHAKNISKRQLLELLDAANDNLRLVVVNACESHAVASDIPPTVDLAIGMDTVVSDVAAIDFAVAFYEGIAHGKSVEKSFKLAVAGLDDNEHRTPQLFPPATADTSDKRKLVLVNP